MIVLALTLLGLVTAQTNTAPAIAAPPVETTALREVSPGVFDYHGVLLDKKNRRITFPATVNQRVGLIEYLLVNEKGKLHESLFSTKIMPHDIHLALLLIGLKPDDHANPNETVPPTAIDSSYLQAAPKLKGEDVRIAVTWTQNGKPETAPAESWVFNLHTNRPMTRGVWTYNGSLVQDGVFLADQEFSIVAVITDPTALVNNPRQGYDDDEIWQLREKAIPPLDSPVEISITLPPTVTTRP